MDNFIFVIVISFKKIEIVSKLIKIVDFTESM